MITPEIFLIAGMPRSASTFSFNITRDILRMRGKVYQESTNSLSGDVVPEDTQFILIKSHSAQDEIIRAVQAGEARSICTVRRPEDAIASWIYMFDMSVDRAIDVMRHWIYMFEKIYEYSLIVRYNDIENNPFLEAQRIAKYICPADFSLNADIIAVKYLKLKVFNSTMDMKENGENVIDIGFSYYNQETFFHRRHVSSMVSRPAEELICVDTLEKIRDALAPHMSPDGPLLKAVG
jgi:hypothetical protein